ncbi:filamentous hemagglutinin N-terminal domain-containing protein, partial [Buttiauxella sp. B2]|uniref:hemagglutinin repeat-containing protein n=1 Tax=Buttiauxella sp. B2 TaxID=2587812 RepID=UPI0011224451
MENQQLPVHFAQRLLSYLICVLLAGQPVFPVFAAPTPANNATQMDRAANGVPVVNIATPNGAGISHNQFQDYNVGKEGIILNNATGQLNPTQLGGLIQNNPHLKAGQEAHGIINEVTGANRSQLQGYTEVAGKAANVMVANPYGITCNGCGFINTPNATLTTGKPVFDANGNLQQLNVTKGSITIEGQGLDGSQTDALSIISRATEINASIHAKDLKVIAGANRVGADGSVTPLAGEGAAPIIAVDTGALGGMYANRIHLVSSDKGVGVNLGNLNARQGDITLDANGKLTVKNSLSSGSFTAKGENITLNGEHKAGGALSVASQSDISLNAAQLASDSDITLNSQGKLNVVNSSITAAKNLTLATLDLAVDQSSRGDAAQNITATLSGTGNTQGQLTAGQNLTLTGNTLTNSGQLAANGDAQISIDALTNNGTVQSQKNLTLTGRSLNNGGSLLSGDALTVDAQTFNQDGQLAAKGNAQVTASQALRNSGSLLSEGSLAVNAGELLQNGTLSGKQNLTLESDKLTTGASSLTTTNGAMALKVEQANLSGEMNASGNLSLEANSLTTTAESQLQTDNQLAIRARLAVLEGTQAAKGALSVSADSLTHSGKSNAASITLTGSDITNSGILVAPIFAINSARLTNSGLLQGNQALNLSADMLDNRLGGTLYSEGNLALTLPTLINAGLISSDRELFLGGDLLTNSGEINAASLKSRTTTLINQRGGLLLADGQMTIDGQVLNNAGQLAANQLTINNDTLTNSGTMQGNRALVVTAKNFASQGQMLSGAELTLNADNLNTGGLMQGKTLNLASGEWINTGNVLSEQNATLRVNGKLANQGKILGQQGVTLTVDTLDNRGWLAATAVTFKGDLINSGLIQGNESLALAGNSLNNQKDGQLLTSGAMVLASQTLGNLGAMQGNSVLLNAGEWSNSGTTQALDELTAHIIGSFTNSGALLSQNQLALNAADITNSGSLAAQALSLVTASLSNDGRLQGNTTLTLDSRNISNLSHGQIVSGGALNLSPGSLDNAGLLQINDDFTLTGEQFSNRGTILANNLLFQLNGALKNEQEGQLLARQKANFTSGTLLNNGVLAADLLTLNSSTITNSGTAQGNHALNLESQVVDNQADGLFLSGGELAIHSTNASNTGIWQGKTVDFAQASLLNNGTINGIDGLTGRVSGELVNGGQLSSQSAIYLSADNLSNSGKIMADTLALEANTFDNSGLWQGMSNLSATGDVLNISATGRALSGGSLRLNAGQLTTAGAVQGGQVNVTTDSWLNSGTLLGADSVNASVSGQLTNTGDLLSQGLTQIHAQTLTNSGALLSAGNMALAGTTLDNRSALQGKNLVLNGDKITNTGTVVGLDSLMLESRLLMAAPLLELVNGGQMLTGGTLTVNGGRITNTGTWQGQGILLNAQQLQNNGAIQSADALTLALSDTLNSDSNSKITANGNATLQALSLANSGQWLAKDLTLKGGTLNNNGDVSGVDELTVSLTGAFTQQQDKTLLTAGRLTLDAASVANLGRIQAGDLVVNTGQLGNSGRLQGATALALNLTGQLTNNTTGSILSQQTLNITTPDLFNYGLIQGGTTARIDAATSARNEGKTVAGGYLTFNTALLINNGWLQANGVTLNAATAVNNGTLLAELQGTFTGNNLTNNGTAQGTSLAVNYQQLTNEGTVLGTSNLNVTADQVNLKIAGKLFSGGNLLLTSSGFDQLGQVVALGDLTLNLTNAFAGKNVLAAGNTLNVISGGAITNQSVMQGQAVNLTAGGELINNAQITTGNGSSTLSGSRIAMNTAGNLQAGGDVALNSRSDITVDGFTGTVGSLTLNAVGSIINTALLYAGNNMALLANSIRNNRGDILAGNNLWMQRDTAGNANAEVVNTSGSIETQRGDMTIKTGHLLNERDGLEVSTASDAKASTILGLGNATIDVHVNVFPAGSYIRYEIPEDTICTGGVNTHCRTIPARSWYEPTAGNTEQKFAYNQSSVAVTASGDAARISAGKDLNASAGSITNNASHILSNGNMTLTGGELSNQSWIQSAATDYLIYSYVSSTDNTLHFKLAGSITDTVNGEAYRAVIQAGGNVTATFTSDISNTTTTAYTGGTSPTINAPTLNTLSNQTIGDALQKQNLAGNDIVAINSPQWNDQLQNALQQINGGSGLDTSGSPTSGLNTYGGNGQGNASLGNATALNNTTAQGSSLNQYQPNGVDTSAYPLPTGQNGYFVTSTDPNSPYLITTNPKLNGLGELDQSLFGDLYTLTGIRPGSAPRETNVTYTDQNTFLGSSYFLDRLNLHPEYDYRFLGDAAFDTRYVSNYVLNQTGNRYINGIGSDLEQMRYLMDNAATQQQSLGLAFGIALTAGQIAALDQSILWWEAATVNGQTVMIPKVYLSPKDVTVNSGSVISGKNVQLAGGSITNSGSTITAQNVLHIDSANSISNLNAGLMQAGGDLQLSALGNINNVGSTISGKTVALESLYGSINNITLVDNWSLNPGGKRGRVDIAGTQPGNVASITSLDSLSLNAGQDINITGANISAGGSLLMQAWGDIAVTANKVTNSYNQSGFRGKDATSSSSVTYNGSTISAGGNIGMQAGNDLTVEASQVNAGENAQLIAGNNLNLNAVQTRESSAKGKSETHRTDNARSTITAGGNLALVAGQDINSQAAGIAAEGDVAMQAGRDVNLLAEETTDGSSYRAKKKVEINESVRQGSTEIASGGNTRIVAGRDVNSEAAQVTASGDIGVGAGRDITLSTATESDYHYKEETKTKKGFLSKKTTHTVEEDSATREAGTLLSGNNVQVQAGNNLLVKGSSVVADDAVNLSAGNNVDIVAATDTDSSWRFKEEKKSGLMGTGGIGITVGSSKTTHNLREAGTTQSQSFSTVGSTGGSVVISAGNQAHIGGADLIAGKDLAVIGDSVLIDPGHDKRSRDETFEQKKSGLTLALSGTVGSAINNAVSSAQDAHEESDDRLSALQATKSALSGIQAAQANATDTANSGNTDNPSTDTIGISASLTTQHSKSEQHAQSDTVTGSTLNAGNNLSVIATGKNKGEHSGDIAIAGSQLKAGGDTLLSAQNDILLSGAGNTQQISGKNSSSGGGVGVGIGVGSGGWGISVFANGNSAHGKEKGNGTDWTETTIDSGNTVTINSGRDTVLDGAQVNGNKIIANVGRDLLMNSQQDNNDYDSKQTSVAAGGSFTFGSMTGSGYISANQDKMKSRFDSVAEQTGLYAGNGGFDITVGNHTQLDGAVIASTATADKNSLDTGTLGFGDLHNEADFKTEHAGGSFNSGGNIGGQFASNMTNALVAGGGNKGHEEGTTQAAVADGAITIRNKENQQQDVADLSRDTEHANDSISPIFDKE